MKLISVALYSFSNIMVYGALFACMGVCALESNYIDQQIFYRDAKQSIHFSHLQTDSELAHPAVKAITQDSMGFIWIATQDGLTKYNGLQSRHYFNDPSNPSSIGDNDIWALYSDSEGRLWIGSESGIHLYTPESDSFVNFLDEPFGLTNGSYKAIKEDSQGNIWFVARKSGLVKFDKTTSTFTSITHNENTAYSLSSNDVIDIEFNSQGVMFVVSTHGLEYSADGGNTFHKFDKLEFQQPENSLASLHIDYQDRLWIGSSNNGIYALNTNQLTLVKRYPKSENPICSNVINDLLTDENGQLWIATNNGVCRLNIQTSEFDLFQSASSKSSSIINNQVNSLWLDAGGVMWFGTQSGVSHWNASLLYFPHINKNAYPKLSSNIITSFATSSDGKLYIGTFEAGLNIIDTTEKSSNSVLSKTSTPLSIADNSIMSLLVDNEEGLWLGTYSSGLLYQAHGSDSFVSFTVQDVPDAGISSNSISKIKQMSNGHIAIGTFGGGVNLYDKANNSFITINTNGPEEYKLSLDDVIDISELASQKLLVATYGSGLNLIDLDKKNVLHFNKGNQTAGLKSNEVIGIENGSKYVWLATSDAGIARIDRQALLNGHMIAKHYSVADGLPSHYTYGVEEDQYGMIWISHKKGLSRFNPQSESFDNFTTTHGLQGNDFNSGAFYKAKDGRLFFGGSNGFNTFMPDHVPINTYKPPLRLTKFSHANLEKPIQSLLRKDGVLELKYKETILDFEFVALDYTKPENNRYQYKMEGLSDVWVNLGTNNHISFSYLADGDYTLRVRGSNNEQVWSDEIVIPIEVLPPFWLSWYAYISYFLALVLGVLSILRQQQIKHQRQLSHERRLHHLAYYDSLTGLPNRQSFYENLEKFISLAKRGNYQAGVMFIDLDRFKRINDTLGHDYGDKVLQEVAVRLKESVRDSDIVARNYDVTNFNNEIARLGGDEFTLFLSHIESAEETTAVTQRILDSLSQPIKIDNYELTITPSIGIAMYPENGSTVNELMKHADIAMYQAKEDGRRTFKFYSNTSNDRALERLQLEEFMRTALTNQEFQLYYQPQVDLEQNRITKAEALIRWIHPELGFIPPDDFISIAEESGIIIELGDWILDTACMQAKAWMDAGIENCRVSVNVSSVQFKQSALIDKVKSALTKSQLPPHLLELELTESAVMSDVEDNIERLQQFKDMGITVAVDDFGTGYSSLSYLKKFPIDTLKIDRSFIDEIDTSENDVAIVKAIMVLAETMGLKVVAEGVETLDQLKILHDFGCQHIQGYFFSKPLPNQDFVQFVEQYFEQQKSLWKLEMIG